MSRGNNIDDIYRNSFPRKDYEVDAAGWEQMSDMLDANNLTRKNNRKGYLFWAFSMLAAGIIAAASYLTLNADSPKYSANHSPVEDFQEADISISQSAAFSTQNVLNGIENNHLYQTSPKKSDANSSSETLKRNSDRSIVNSTYAQENAEKPVNARALANSGQAYASPEKPQNKAISRIAHKFDNLKQRVSVELLHRDELPQAQILDLEILSKKDGRRSYYQPWRKSFYLLGGVSGISPVATDEEQRVSTSDLNIDARQFEIGLGSYFEKGNFRFGVGLHHNSITRGSQFESMSVKDTVLLDIETRTEITNVDSTFLGYVPNRVQDANGNWIYDGVRPNWQVDTSYRTVRDTSFTNSKDTSYSIESGQLRQQYLEVPLSMAYVWSKGRFKLAIQGGYSLGYLVSERITYSSDNNAALEHEYTSDKSLLHFLVFNPEMSYAVGSRASIFAQPTYRYRLSGGSTRAFEPGQLGLRFGIMYDF